MKKNVTALAIAVAGLTVGSANAAVPQISVAAGAQIQIGCTAPSAGGSVVYSIDAGYINSTLPDTITMPTGVSAGVSCGQALNVLLGQVSVAGSSVGRRTNVNNGTTTPSLGAGSNVVVPGTGYSLVTYTLVAQ